MITTRPIATVHYCEIKILKAMLDKLYLRNKITFYAFVFHYAEEDEGKKNHIHLYIEPNGRINCDELREELIVPTEDITRPIRCLPFKPSKWNDWYLYSLHDIRYLISKGQARKYHYSIDDIYASDNYMLMEMVHTIDLSKLNANFKILEAVENNISFEQMVKSGQVPLQLINQYRTAYMLISGQTDFLYRNGKKGHEPTTADIKNHIKATADTIKQQENGYDQLSDTDDLPF